MDGDRIDILFDMLKRLIHHLCFVSLSGNESKMPNHKIRANVLSQLKLDVICYSRLRSSFWTNFQGLQ